MPFAFPEKNPVGSGVELAAKLNLLSVEFRGLLPPRRLDGAQCSVPEVVVDASPAPADVIFEEVIQNSICSLQWHFRQTGAVESDFRTGSTSIRPSAHRSGDGTPITGTSSCLSFLGTRVASAVD